jgi:large subunit ribosomal protein L22
MPAIAIQKGVRISPRKVAVVAALVRGRSVEDALTILDYTPRRAALPVREAIKSAAANAEHNHSYKPNTLEITEISVTSGPRLKRFIPAARGRARRFQRKTSHIRVVVDGQKREAKKVNRPTKPVEAEKEAK